MAPAARSLRDRVGALRGFELAQAMLEVDRTQGSVRVEGLAVPPQLARGNRDEMTLIVNGRAVRDTALLQTLIEAYRPMLARHEFPSAVLIISMPLQELDVNVHPTKAWVRFRSPRLVQEAVFLAVQDALRSRRVVQPQQGLTSPDMDLDYVGGYTVITPKRPFMPSKGCYGPGAWELAAQYSQFHVGSADFINGFVSPTVDASQLSQLMLGVNWWMNKYTRVSFDWVNDRTNKAVPVSTGKSPRPSTVTCALTMDRSPAMRLGAPTAFSGSSPEMLDATTWPCAAIQGPRVCWHGPSGEPQVAYPMS